MTKPLVTFIPDTGEWELGAAYVYQGHGVDIVIPPGYRFDLASIPRFLWRVIAPFELSIAAPLVHDYLYQREGKIDNKKLSRLETDQLFRAMMKDEKVSAWRRVVAYRAVRMFGGAFWG